MPSSRSLFVGLYALSGAAALVYEIAWTRLLTLQMGQTVAAVSTVLAAFMGGLAAGSWLGSRMERRWSERPTADRARLRAYAALEILVAALRARAAGDARGIPPAARVGVRRRARACALCHRARVSVCRDPGDAGRRHGRDLSDRRGMVRERRRRVAERRADRRPDRRCRRGRAVRRQHRRRRAGALAAGFWLLPALGVWQSTLVGVALNVAAAAGALALARSGGGQRTSSAADAVLEPARCGSYGTSASRGAAREIRRRSRRSRRAPRSPRSHVSPRRSAASWRSSMKSPGRACSS